jgi:hypothetical protein
MFLGDQIKRKGDQLLPPGIPASETGLGKGLVSSFKLTTHLELVLQIMLETHPQDSSVPSPPLFPSICLQTGPKAP